ncbi:MAG: 3-oxoacyl-ACP synthase [Pricia sp.]|nr:3-oxoacyl-ACP synthase [Pricia sp.]
MSSTKQKLFAFCQTFAQDRIARIEKSIENIRESLYAETKSSAGDKHETGRAMLQLEREKLGQQLIEAEKMKEVLAKVRLENSKVIVGLGSWVKTSKADYFLAISAGKFNKENLSVYCISVGTPIGRSLIGKSEGDSFSFNGETIKILKID